MVTGGGSGIGKGVAAAVVAAGGKAMLVGRNVDRLSGAADEIEAQAGDGNVLYEPADVTNAERGEGLLTGKQAKIATDIVTAKLEAIDRQQTDAERCGYSTVSRWAPPRSQRR